MSGRYRRSLTLYEVPPRIRRDGDSGSTLSRIRHYKELALFLLAFWIYNDGIGTIIKMPQLTVMKSASITIRC